MTAREYHDRTGHSPASVRTSRHTLEWGMNALPFKVYSDLSAIPLPREIDPLATDALAALAAPAAPPPGGAAPGAPRRHVHLGLEERARRRRGAEEHLAAARVRLLLRHARGVVEDRRELGEAHLD